LLKLLTRFRPREGWLPLLLLLVAIVCLPAALYGPGDSGSLFLLAMVATLAGLRLARSRLAARPAGMAGGLAGVLVVVATVGRLWPSLHLLGREATESIAWLKGVPGAAGPLSTLAGFFWQRGNALWMRLWWWGQRAAAGSGGAGNQDPIVLELLLAGLVWGLSLLAGWQVYRRHSALAGLLPAGVVLAVVAFFRGSMAYFYLFTYLGCMFSLIAACRLWRSRARWDADGTDYPGDMGLELAFSVAPWMTALLILGFVFPVMQVRPLRDAFWRAMDGPWARVEQAAERYFGPIDSGYPLGRAGSGESAGLPRAHLLGAGHHLVDTRVGTAGDDHQALIHPGQQGLFDDAAAHLACAPHAGQDLLRAVHLDHGRTGATHLCSKAVWKCLGEVDGHLGVRGQQAGQAPGMIAVYVRQDDDVDGVGVQAQGGHIVQQHGPVGSGVKEHRPAAVTQPGGKAPAGLQAGGGGACCGGGRGVVVENDGQAHGFILAIGSRRGLARRLGGVCGRGFRGKGGGKVAVRA